MAKAAASSRPRSPTTPKDLSATAAVFVGSGRSATPPEVLRPKRGMACALPAPVERTHPAIAAAMPPLTMSGEGRQEAAMVDRTHTTTHTPTWWTDKHTSDWERVKAALERDWEQTKADFSKDGGQKLNQNLADTVKQSVGADPIPPLGMKTRPTDPKVALKEAEKARETMGREATKAAQTLLKAHDVIVEHQLQLSEKVGEVWQDLATHQAIASEKKAGARAKASDKRADAHVKASDERVYAHVRANAKIEGAQERAIGGIAKARARIEAAGVKRDEAIAKWHEAEQEVRYGYSVRTQYPASSVWNHKLEGELRGEWNGLATGVPWNVSRRGIRRGWDYAARPL
jgi:hypothetical protein